MNVTSTFITKSISLQPRTRCLPIMRIDNRWRNNSNVNAEIYWQYCSNASSSWTRIFISWQFAEFIRGACLCWQPKRRTVLGMREVAKNLKMSRLKAVIISPNVGKNQSKGNFLFVSHFPFTLHTISARRSIDQTAAMMVGRFLSFKTVQSNA